MSEVLDEAKTLTIKLYVPPFGHITNISAPSQARAGDTITITVTVQNTGSSGTLFVKMIDLSNMSVVYNQRQSVSAGASANFTATLTMPNRDLNLQIQAGHIEIVGAI